MFGNIGKMFDAIEKVEEIKELAEGNMKKMESIFEKSDKMYEFTTTLMGWSRDLVGALNFAKECGADNDILMESVVWPALEDLKERMNKI